MLRAHSSVGQSSGLIIRRSEVQVLLGPLNRKRTLAGFQEREVIVRATLLAVLVLFQLVGPLSGQLSVDSLEARIRAGSPGASGGSFLGAAEAARLLLRYDVALPLLDQAEEILGPRGFGVLQERIKLVIASGGGVEAAIQALREGYGHEEIPPLDIASWVNGSHFLLNGPEFHPIIEKLSGDADDPEWRCVCHNQKALMYRAAGQPEMARTYWDSLTAKEENYSTEGASPSVTAFIKAVRVRDLARVGRTTDAREVLGTISIEGVRDAERPEVRRRLAEAYAELGEVDLAVAELEWLLSVPSPVTVHTLEVHPSWWPVKDQPAFKDLLSRHR